MRAARLASLVAASACVAAAAADFEIRSPAVDVRELELDYKLAAARDHARSHVVELEYGVNEWWSPAVEGEWVRDPGAGGNSRFEATTFENRFRLSPRRARWGDLGLFVEVERGAGQGPHALRAGPMLRVRMGPTTSLLNVFAVRERGAGSRNATAYTYAWQTRWNLSERLQPGFEIYGGALEAGVASPKRRLGGPVLFGVLDMPGAQDVRYEVGYLRALDAQAVRATFKLLVGYERTF